MLRVVLGTCEDRLTDGGIARHIEQVVKVCQSQSSRAVDAGVKIAVENHAGDMHSTELAQLVEAAGKDFVGVNLDSGNALWTLEDPIDSLRTLAPYVADDQPSRLRGLGHAQGRGGRVDGHGRGADRPEGVLHGVPRAVSRASPVHIETISGFNREFPFLTPEFWKAWPAMPAPPFRTLPRPGQAGEAARQAFKAPDGADKRAAEQAYQRGEIERSLKYCREALVWTLVTIVNHGDTKTRTDGGGGCSAGSRCQIRSVCLCVVVSGGT